ncbi:hypothetical protein WR25_26987 [Diploscapter pachys]|uniref:glucuronosyltransferase n=1 Tax=Diploscapter pachys TaxID=2018661 RepID=A0A2A2KBZ3_9BILA|nr:hypothetical protein WR25_26987 [Diploscapter pachys]
MSVETFRLLLYHEKTKMTYKAWMKCYRQNTVGCQIKRKSTAELIHGCLAAHISSENVYFFVRLLDGSIIVNVQRNDMQTRIGNCFQSLKCWTSNTSNNNADIFVRQKLLDQCQPNSPNDNAEHVSLELLDQEVSVDRSIGLGRVVREDSGIVDQNGQPLISDKFLDLNDLLSRISPRNINAYLFVRVLDGLIADGSLEPAITTPISGFFSSSLTSARPIPRIKCINSYKVLVYCPMMYYSHMNFMNSIADILAEAGNDVTVFMPVIDDRYVNKTGLKFVEKVIFKRAEQDLIDIHIQMNGLNNTKAAFNQWGMTSSVISLIPLMIAAMDLPKKIAQSVFNDKSLLEKLEAEKFDLGIAEPVGLTGFALFDHIKIPVTISATSMVQFPIVADAIGEPMSASFVPGHLVAFTDEMSFLERTINIASQTMFYYFLRLLGGFELGAIEDIVGKKEWRELIGKISYSFHHSHPYIDFPRPEMPKTIPIGGITLEKSASVNMTLPEEWDEILSVRETNILISFGTYAKTSDMPDEYKKNFISLFEKFPNTTFIWKYEDPEEELFQGIDNLVLTKWMPQVPLLADPRLSLFIMHGGIGSTIEVAHSGKPAVVIPIQGDQRRNAAALRKHKVALTLHKEDLGDKDKLIDAVVEVLGAEDYQKRAKRLSELLKNRPFSAKELVLKHCNLAAKFGPLVELDSYGKNLGAIRYYLIDVVLLLIFITLLTISLISLCCVYTCVE